MRQGKVRPVMVFADAEGRIYDHPDLLMLCRRGRELALPRPDELTPLPDESEFFLLPGRGALGLDPESGQVEALEETAVAAFVRPGYTVAGLAAYHTADPSKAPTLPLFSYAAVGFANGRFWTAAKLVDEDKRQIFSGIPAERIKAGAKEWLRRFPDNRLVRHLAGCALTNCCPAARNLCLGRFEAPLPTSRVCNARCLGCLSLQPADSGFPATQNRIGFAPEPEEIVEIMLRHAEREKKPVFSFGQGCEGEPLTEAPRIAKATALFRAAGGPGVVNINTNGSLPGTIPELAAAGLTSLRVSLVSALPDRYAAYHRPAGFAWADVRETIFAAKKAGLFVSLNLLYFPGVTDTEEEFAALVDLVAESRLDFIQLRNLNLDPELYLGLLADKPLGPSMGLAHFRKRLRKANPWLKFGYFNPYTPDLHREENETAAE